MKRKMDTQALLGTGFSEDTKFANNASTPSGNLYGNLCNYGSGFSPNDFKHLMCRKKEKIDSVSPTNEESNKRNTNDKCGSGGNKNSNNNYANQAAIINTNMSKWVRFDHDCRRPDYCTECEKNQQKTRKVVFTSGGDVTINTSGNEDLTLDNSFVNNTSSVNNNEEDLTLLDWDSKSSSFKLVINVPMVDLALFQSNKFHVEIVCSDKVHGGTVISSQPLSNSVHSQFLSKGGRRQDFEIIERNLNLLRQSGWYWEKVDSETSKQILSSCQPGTFMIRDSSDPRYLFSLSVQTEKGPTSVRLIFRNGKFSLDASEKLTEILPKFDTVPALIEYYVNGGAKIGKQVWVDPSGKKHSPVTLNRPKRQQVPSLKHLCRLVMNTHHAEEDLKLPEPMKSFILKYPYTL